MEAGAAGEGAATAVADLKIVAAQNELRTLGGCCKDSDNVLERINTLHDSLSKQGATRRCARARDPCCCWPQAPRAVRAAIWPSGGGAALVCPAGDRQRSTAGGKNRREGRGRHVRSDPVWRVRSPGGEGAGHRSAMPEAASSVPAC